MYRVLFRACLVWLVAVFAVIAALFPGLCVHASSQGLGAAAAQAAAAAKPEH